MAFEVLNSGNELARIKNLPENIEKGGILITNILDNRPDWELLQAGDVIVFYNKKDVRRNKDLFIEEMKNMSTDNLVPIKIVRKDKNNRFKFIGW